MNDFLQMIALYGAIIIVLLITLTVHELGHFIFAILFHVNVKEFSIGIGPKIFTKKTKNNLLVSLRWLPIMAYVSIDSRKARQIMLEDASDHANYEWAKSPLTANKKLLEDVSFIKYQLIMLGGVIFNLFLFFWVWSLNYYILAFHPVFQHHLDSFDPFKQLNASLELIWQSIILKKGEGNVFVQVPDLVNKISLINWVYNLLNFLMMLNLISFIFNLIPIPPLDGFKIIQKTVEKITKKNMPIKYEIYLTLIGVIFLSYLFLSSFLNKYIGW